MKVFKVISLFIGILVVALVGLYAYMGGFKTITISKANFAETEIIYMTHKGPYEKLHETWTAFTNKFRKLGLENCNGYGIYLDPPETPPEKLRSIIACGTKNISPEQLQTLKAEFPTFTLPATEVYSSSFPFKNMLSYFMAPTKVYPKFKELIDSGDLQPSVAIEAYGFEKDRNKILFYMPTGISREEYQPLIEAF